MTAVDRRRRPYHRANRGSYVDFAAPGVAVWGAMADGKGRFWHGTSFASIYGSAIVAVEALDSTQIPGADQAYEKLRQGVVDLGDPGRDDVFGWGLVQLQSGCARGGNEFGR